MAPPASSPNPGSNDRLLSVSALSPGDVWAAGTYDSSKPMIVHWNGTSWSQATIPNASITLIYGIDAFSANDVWAAGTVLNLTDGATDTLILHWNGKAWSAMKTPNPSSTYNQLVGVSADSPTDAWAAGSYTDTKTGATDTLMLHWNGKAWSAN